MLDGNYTQKEVKKVGCFEARIFHPLTRDWFSGSSHVGRCRFLGSRQVDGRPGVPNRTLSLSWASSEQRRWQ